MLISIVPWNLEPDEGRNYVMNEMYNIGIMVEEVVSKFIQRDEGNDETEPSYFTHRMLVANIPTLEKFFEAVAVFERDGWVDIESYGTDCEKWGYQGIELVDKSCEKYYHLPSLNIEVRGGIYY